MIKCNFAIIQKRGVNMKERKLSKREQQRKEEFDKLIEQMKQDNYELNKLTIGVVYANVMGLVIMLPFIVLFYFLFNQLNPNISLIFSLTECFILLCLIIIFTVLHEMIHGIVFAKYAKHRFQSVEFGIIWNALTPYCTCKDPLKKSSYIVALIMPTVILGFILAIISTIIQSALLFVLAELMIIGGGGDFLMFIKLLGYHSNKKEQLFYDSPYEIGLVVFEK